VTEDERTNTVVAPCTEANALSEPAARDWSSVTAQQALEPAARRQMLALLTTYFDGVTVDQFERDLHEKHWVLRIWRGERLVGFTTVQLSSTTIDGAPVRVLCSGDTIMSPEAWGSPVLARAWIEMVRTLQQATPGERWVWLLLTSGYRTYRFLPVFWREFWPRHDADTPVEMQHTIAALAAARFGNLYDRTAGIVRFATPQRLRGTLAVVDAGHAADAHIAFFLAANPGHAEGDELVCVTELSNANLTAAGRRMLRARQSITAS